MERRRRSSGPLEGRPRVVEAATIVRKIFITPWKSIPNAKKKLRIKKIKNQPPMARVGDCLVGWQGVLILLFF